MTQLDWIQRVLDMIPGRVGILWPEVSKVNEQAGHVHDNMLEFKTETTANCLSHANGSLS